LWGIGPETADSILLYAFKVPTFVVDAYTKRVFSHLGIINKTTAYNKIKEIFENNLPKNLKIYQEYHAENNLPKNLKIYQEYHALIVEHAKRYYSKKTEYHMCPLYKKFKKL